MRTGVLLVDDSVVVRRAIRKSFESAGVLVCGEAENGAQALEQAQILKPDLVVMDLAMPIMNGLQAAPRLRQLLPAVPIILFTLHSTALAQQASACGITEIISKGEPLTRLVSCVKSLLLKARTA